MVVGTREEWDIFESFEVPTAGKMKFHGSSDMIPCPSVCCLHQQSGF
jgi:hypothetical protein